MKLNENIFRFIISSPSRFVDNYVRKNIRIDHFWDFNDSANLKIQQIENPFSRNYYVITLRRKQPKDENGKVKSYNMFKNDGNEVMMIMSVLFGKRFDFHGNLQSGNFLSKPNINNIIALDTYNWPFNSYKKRIDTNIDLKLSNLSLCKNIIDKIGRQRPKSHTTFFNASNLYCRALQNFDENPDLSYIDLVSAGEILTANFKMKEKYLYDESLKSIFSSIKDNCKDYINIIDNLKSRLYQVRTRFANGLSTLLDDSFFLHTYSTNKQWSIQKENILTNLKYTYDLRSQLIHSGLEIGRVLNIDNLGAELFSVIPLGISKDNFKKLSKSLNFIGLERVIRYSLLKLIKVI